MNEQETTPIISIQGLRKVYRVGSEELEILKAIDWEVTRATTVLVLGESGSGKSTLLNLIGGLDYPTAGRIVVEGLEISELAESKLSVFRTHTLGFIFQFHYLLKDFTALENVLLPAMVLGCKRKQALPLARELIAEVGLTAREHHYPSQLSGGERQRVAVARALINSPSLILADEPTGNLDERNAASVLELLFRLVDKYHKTLLIVSHDTSISKRVALTYRLEHGALKQC